MRIKFVKDEWIGKKLAIIYKNNEYVFGNSDTLFLDIDESDKRFIVKNPNKSFVIFNVVDLICDIFFGDSICSFVACDYSFEIIADENCEIMINRNKCSPHQNMEYTSFYAKSDTAEIVNEGFYPKTLKKLSRKHARRCYFLMSGLPLYIIVAILSAIFSENLLFLFIPLFLIYTIPSVIERVRFKKLTKEDKITARLTENAIGYRTYNDYDERIKTKTEKFMAKLIDKLFR